MSRHDWAASESEGPILQIVVQRKRAEERDDTDREGADVCVSDPRQAQFAKLMSQRLSFDFTCASSCIAPSQRCIILASSRSASAESTAGEGRRRFWQGIGTNDVETLSRLLLLHRLHRELALLVLDGRPGWG